MIWAKIGIGIYRMITKRDYNIISSTYVRELSAGGYEWIYRRARNSPDVNYTYTDRTEMHIFSDRESKSLATVSARY